MYRDDISVIVVHLPPLIRRLDEASAAKQPSSTGGGDGTAAGGTAAAEKPPPPQTNPAANASPDGKPQGEGAAAVPTGATPSGAA